MRMLVSGLSGTLAPVLARVLQKHGHTVLAWDHRRLGFADAAAFDALRPDAVAHLAMAGAEASAAFAGLAAERGLPFVATSSAMVFHHEPDGPHHLGDVCNARDDYGRSKIAMEQAVLAAHPGASVVRIGWQFDPDATGNNMLAALDGWQASQGEVAASRAWVPACSLMEDTATALISLRSLPGIHHVDGNAVSAWTFDRVAAALAARFSRPDWRLRVHEDYRHDQRLLGGTLEMPSLDERLA